MEEKNIHPVEDIQDAQKNGQEDGHEPGAGGPFIHVRQPTGKPNQSGHNPPYQ
jgi:hypothetical protein